MVEIDPLASLPKLQFLSLLDNNITKKPNYRLYVIHKLKSLRLLDFKRVKHEEQIEAKNLFSSEEDEEQAKKEFAKTFVLGEAPSITEDPKEEQAPKPVAPTPEQIITIKAAIVNSQTLEEVARLEKILKSVIMMPRPTLKQPKKTKWSQMRKTKLMMGQVMLSLNRRMSLQTWNRLHTISGSYHQCSPRQSHPIVASMPIK